MIHDVANNQRTDDWLIHETTNIGAPFRSSDVHFVGSPLGDDLHASVTMTVTSAKRIRVTKCRGINADYVSPLCLVPEARNGDGKVKRVRKVRNADSDRDGVKVLRDCRLGRRGNCYEPEPFGTHLFRSTRQKARSFRIFLIRNRLRHVKVIETGNYWW